MLRFCEYCPAQAIPVGKISLLIPSLPPRADLGSKNAGVKRTSTPRRPRVDRPSEPSGPFLCSPRASRIGIQFWIDFCIDFGSVWGSQPRPKIVPESLLGALRGHQERLCNELAIKNVETLKHYKYNAFGASAGIDALSWGQPWLLRLPQERQNASRKGSQNQSILGSLFGPFLDRFWDPFWYSA